MGHLGRSVISRHAGAPPLVLSLSFSFRFVNLHRAYEENPASHAISLFANGGLYVAAMDSVFELPSPSPPYGAGILSLLERTKSFFQFF